ncbi:ketopantoate reductase family protein [Microbacterium allomyrinae]|uniref:Ketopantoate reductase n=1 Tax=Microbacterium allomyrinae TaxID=2830666 RepID=A0A9X1S1E1_9MICO|nr:2-dehydropantoate 2-reductase N-terminal domain-containing protein [Microbacterium allomyrinae]MCC2031586.1 ketopantoate reductase [Microbacterium allomyrinae]
MRILMFGRGVIATIYGRALQVAGHDVEFYVRPGRAALYGEGVTTDLIDARRSPLGRPVREAVPIWFKESLEPGDGFDLVILSVAHHRLAEAAAFLAPRVGDATVLVFGNVWQEPLAAIAPLSAAQVVFGFPQAGGGFDDADVLHGALFGAVILGMSGTLPDTRELAVKKAFGQAGLTVREERDMRGWLWLHFISDVGMHVQGHRYGGLAGMIGNRRAFREALLTSRELLPVLEARGVDLRRHRRTVLPYRLPTQTSAAMAWATARFPIAQVSLSTHTDPDAAEPRAVLRDALQEARRLGIPTPRLAAALTRSRRLPAV